MKQIIKKNLLLIILFAVSISLYKLDDIYIDKSAVAKKGIFTDERILNLKEYTNIGSGYHFILGDYKIYSRSVTHQSFIVYDNPFGVFN